jgi:hypothetical protein
VCGALVADRLDSHDTALGVVSAPDADNWASEYLERRDVLVESSISVKLVVIAVTR